MPSPKNTLEVGQSRIGSMIDGFEETPRVAVKLERTATRIVVTIPFIDGRDDLYQYWFSDGWQHGHDPHQVKRRYEPPNSINFEDANGSVGLVGSRRAGAVLPIFTSGLGEGRLAFNYAILGASDEDNYELINGLRSEVEGLGTWIGLRSLQARPQFIQNRLQSVNLKLESPPPIRVGRLLNAEFQANWRYGAGPGPDQTTITERMQVQTRVKKQRDWEDHLRCHLDVRNLLRIAAWRRLNFVSHSVINENDPMRTSDGVARGTRWLPVVTYLTGITDEPTKLSVHDFLFSFSDIGASGVSKWISLNKNLGRGLNHLVGVLDIDGASLDAHLAQVGIGFEMLGYDLMLASGYSKTKAKEASFADKVRAVSSEIATVLPFEADAFPGRLRRTYVGVKHADRERPAWREMELA